MKVDIPLEVLEIITTLNNYGFKAYIVGGCVRDIIMGVNPKDWDITTNATPENVIKFFTKTIKTGLKHGTVTVVLNQQNFEVTTFRIDGIYLDNRRPETVTYTSHLHEDLSRRDFTINAIAYHPNEGYIDPFFGINDIRSKLIKAVGDPDKRFKEDALRMMRAIRFSSKTEFKIDNDTKFSIKKNSNLIKKVSFERIRDEIEKTITSKKPEKFHLFYELDILKYILPEITYIYDDIDKITKMTTMLNLTENTSILRWASIFIYNKDVMPLLKKMKLDNKSIEKISIILEYLDFIIRPDIVEIKLLLNKIGFLNFTNLIKLKSAFFIDQKFELDKILFLADEIFKNNEPYQIKSLDISGNDLLDRGYIGKQIRYTLEYLLGLVIRDKNLNKKDLLLKFLEKNPDNKE